MYRKITEFYNSLSGWFVYFAILFSVLSVGATMGITKYVHRAMDIGVSQIVATRYLMAVFFVSPFIVKAARSGWPSFGFKFFFYRGLIGTTSTLLFGIAFLNVPMHTVSLIGSLAPIVTTLMAAYFFHEKVKGGQVAAILIGFFGAIITLAPSLVNLKLSLYYLVAIGGVFTISVGNIMNKTIAKVEGDLRIITCYFVIFFAFFSSLVAIPSFRFEILWESLPMLSLLGFITALNIFCLLFTYRVWSISFIQALELCKIITVGLVDYFYFEDPINSFEVIGGLVISFSVSYALRLEERRKAQAKATKIAK